MRSGLLSSNPSSNASIKYGQVLWHSRLILIYLKIVFEFPTPRPYSNVTNPQHNAPQHEANHIGPADNTSTANGAQVPATPVRPLPPVPAFNSSAISISPVPESLPNSQAAPSVSQIPVLLQQMLTSIQSTLRSCFSQNPPHTIQRLAELVLHPKKYYKTLPAWLRAVDRVVSVSSTADIFPLPHAQPLPNSVIDESLLNGTSNEEQDGTGSGTGGGGILWDNSRERANGIDAGLGSDESLGGALLTPIPWLVDGQGLHDSSNTEASTATQDSSDSDMLIVPDRENGAVTQGELIRQEQEAGVVPVSSSMGGAHSRMMSGAHETGADDVMADEELEDAIPHARGPGIVGTVDMGFVGGRGVEVSIESGEQRLQEDKTGVVSDAQTVLEQGKPKNGEDEKMQVDAAGPSDSESDSVLDDSESNVIANKADADDDIVLVDIDGKTEEQEGRADNLPEIAVPEMKD